MLHDVVLEHVIAEDFDKFDFEDKPMEKHCAYHRSKHISMVVQLTKQRFSYERVCDWTEVEDFIHGLNHIFFNGVAAGQAFEWTKRKDK